PRSSVRMSVLRTSRVLARPFLMAANVERKRPMKNQSPNGQSPKTQNQTAKQPDRSKSKQPSPKSKVQSQKARPPNRQKDRQLDCDVSAFQIWTLAVWTLDFTV